MGVHDLNFGLHICDAFGFKRPGVTHERGQDTVCASHGVRAVEDLRTHHRAPQWRRRCAHLELRRFVSGAGLRAIDVARVLARHRGLPDSQSGQAFSHGIEGRTCALDAVGCIEPAGLARHHALAMRLIARARELYAKEPLGIDLDATVYALDATTIDLCLSLFDWAPFRSTK